MGGSVQQEPPGTPTPTPAVHRGAGRGVLAVVLVLIGVLLAPAAVVGAWARVTMTDTDRFVATYGPLADDPVVQQFLTDQVVAVVDQAVDVDQLTRDLLDGIASLGAGSRTTAALQALQPSLVQAVEQLVRARTAELIASDAFGPIWSQTLRVSHAQAIATLAGDPDAVLVGASDGTLSIQLRPIVAAVRDRLVDQGFALAARVPDVDRQVQISTAHQLPAARLGYELVLVVGAWLAPVALALIVGGVLVARRRLRALRGAGFGLAAVMGLLIVGLVLVRAVAVAQAPSTFPGAVVRVVLAAVTAPMVTTAQAVAVLAVVVGLVAWVAGPGPAAGRLRSGYQGLTGRARGLWGTRPVPAAVGWVGRRRVVLRIVVALIAAAAVLGLRPLTPSTVAGVLLGAVLLLVAVDLAAREEVRG
ncbi:MAG: hypothetical protein L6367_11450 [Cellulomonas sp.]|nr:hypothetical protein [Cellulomonas sp.]